MKGQKNAQRRYLRPEGLLKLPDMLISPNFLGITVCPVWHFLFYTPIRVCHSRTVSSLTAEMISQMRCFSLSVMIMVSNSIQIEKVTKRETHQVSNRACTA